MITEISSNSHIASISQIEEQYRNSDGLIKEVVNEGQASFQQVSRPNILPVSISNPTLSSKASYASPLNQSSSSVSPYQPVSITNEIVQASVLKELAPCDLKKLKNELIQLFKPFGLVPVLSYQSFAHPTPAIILDDSVGKLG